MAKNKPQNKIMLKRSKKNLKFEDMIISSGW